MDAGQSAFMSRVPRAAILEPQEVVPTGSKPLSEGLDLPKEESIAGLIIIIKNFEKH